MSFKGVLKTEGIHRLPKKRAGASGEVQQGQKCEDGVCSSSLGDITKIDLVGEARPWENIAGEMGPANSSL